MRTHFSCGGALYAFTKDDILCKEKQLWKTAENAKDEEGQECIREDCTGKERR